jgi:hypothetical protein
VTELYVFCEGLTEQGFCQRILGPHLFNRGGCIVHTIRTAHSKHHGIVSRGGIGKYLPLRRDIQNTLKMHRRPNVFFTTMIDLYALPSDFPGKAYNTRDAVNPIPYVHALEEAFRLDIDDHRFFPYLQLHEYEALLFADPDVMLQWFDNCQPAVEQMKAIALRFATVEHINDGLNTAPSKRIIQLLPAYSGRKTAVGPQVAEGIGLVILRQRCPHFDGWISTLEQLILVEP